MAAGRPKKVSSEVSIKDTSSVADVAEEVVKEEKVEIKEEKVEVKATEPVSDVFPSIEEDEVKATEPVSDVVPDEPKGIKEDVVEIKAETIASIPSECKSCGFSFKSASCKSCIVFKQYKK